MDIHKYLLKTVLALHISQDIGMRSVKQGVWRTVLEALVAIVV